MTSYERIEGTAQAGRPSTDRQAAVADYEDAIVGMRPRLLAIARSLRARDPEDIVQATIEIALRRRAQLRDPQKLWPWLVSIEVRESWRLSRRFRDFAVPARGPTVSAPDHSQMVELRDALERLPRRMRSAVVLRYMADLTVRDTALALGTSENTVKTQVRQGLRRLREALDG